MKHALVLIAIVTTVTMSLFNVRTGICLSMASVTCTLFAFGLKSDDLVKWAAIAMFGASALALYIAGTGILFAFIPAFVALFACLLDLIDNSGMAEKRANPKLWYWLASVHMMLMLWV